MNRKAHIVGDKYMGKLDYKALLKLSTEKPIETSVVCEV